MSYFFQLISTIIVGTISLFLSFFIARKMGASDFGQYSTALAIGSILAIFLDGGLRNLLMREFTRTSDHLSGMKVNLPQIAMGHSLMAALATSALCLMLIADNLYLALTIIWCFWGAVITQYASSLLRAEGKINNDSLWQVKQRTLTALLIIIAVLLGYCEVYQVLGAWAIGALCANLFFKDGFRFKPKFKPLLSSNINIYRTLLPFLCIDLSTNIYFRSDLILLRVCQVSNFDIGQYAAAYRLIEITTILAAPFSIRIFRKVRMLHNTKFLQKTYIAKMFLASVIFGLAGSVIIQLVGEPLVKYTYGTDFTQTPELLSILGWMIALLIPNTVLTQAALALNFEKSYALTATLAAIGNISLNFWLIPEFGTMATAYSSIATELIILVGLSISIARKN